MLYNDRATDVLPLRPTCDVCGSGPAAVDGKTAQGAWGYMCEDCHRSFGFDGGRQLGMGVGQVLLCGDALDATLLANYELERR
jgi:hypothetical protein